MPASAPDVPSPSPSSKPAAYWDSLSTLWLTRSALHELQRRLHARTPASRRCSRTTAALLQQCPPRCRREIQRLSRRGGPDLSDLRGCPPPRIDSSGSHGAPSSAAMPSARPTSRQTSQIPATTTTPYSLNFEQNLVDHQIYPPLYNAQHSGTDDNEPSNVGEIRRRLAAPRPSLDASSTLSKVEYQRFRKTAWAATRGADVRASVFPFIEGASSSPQQSISRDTHFTNLAPLTDGTISHAKPDISHGARPDQLHREIRTQLGPLVVPSADNSFPLAPNFHAEVKGPGGAPAVAVRQACYDGALSARAMDALRSYDPVEHQQQYNQSQSQSQSQSDQPSLGPGSTAQTVPADNNAYALTATYSGGLLNLFASHSTTASLATPDGPRRPEYTMTPLRSFALTDDVESFCAGAAAYRNARDWAGEVRDEAIARANRRLEEARAGRLDSVVEEESVAGPG
ncbi:hypothetical protein P170DRAFT_450965 [Aspergillus steynii IBT 23096]|uniref:Uncharacterized protein n=1 Tax=Aspergillus steynii IBT 23096 TaxID=1392250 RepID=A0A2I2FT31_9EURO|nr:uncharacterized protein P170DRAFT_450965 [Aspergillus steynii IBT 23096]PLB43803.1 hypothetical protein P170DRAFT_450965 [Aspergillus steynii IBT 23096]